ncbi:hypothetical protein RJT34_33088 [Clitoria ternatea]|uniref:Uncharacterized protein n=1 Tax=Clitoria ternatea TaxID=43366 RepID=A0AAN9EZQ3_CLITE
MPILGLVCTKYLSFFHSGNYGEFINHHGCRNSVSFEPLQFRNIYIVVSFLLQESRITFPSYNGFYNKKFSALKQLGVIAN